MPTPLILLLLGLVAAPAAEIEPRRALVLPGLGRGGRAPVAVDPLQARIVAGERIEPKEGDELALPDGSSRAWAPLDAGEDGAFPGRTFSGGYAFIAIPCESERVMILDAAGHGMVYVNGEPRVGDPYGHGYVRVPVALKAGDNGLLFHAGRGQLRVKLSEPRAEVQVEAADATMPDLFLDRAPDTWGAVVVLNATTKPLQGATLRARLADAEPVETPLPTVPPLGLRKVPVRIAGPRPDVEGSMELDVSVIPKGRETPVDSASVSLRVLRPGQTHKRTFRSEIDGSIQYFGLVPAEVGDGSGEGRRPGLVLTLHGAGVEGIGQADVYVRKPFAHVVAPTNRRPYGFDWEDWGRLDAIEVLETAARELDVDPRRTWLTGHSMGGHGTWHVGVTFPDRFAAIAPSAGWVSMTSYAGARQFEADDPVAGLLRRAASPGDTLALARNLEHLGVYVLHGDADDNVPVDQARTMRRDLGGFHPDFAYYERPGAGHWWGNECCDWPPLMEFLRAREIPEPSAIARVDFATANPGVSARAHWATIEAQKAPMAISSIHLVRDPKARRISGRTDNVARLSLDVRQLDPGGPIKVELDGWEVDGLPDAGTIERIWLARGDETWSRVDPPSPVLKGPHRSGPFKDAFRHRMMFVYGTRGTAEENAWGLAKARFDAETFWYRGNGSVDVVPDTAFDPGSHPDRGVILYGNADTNAAWGALLGESPVQVRRGSIAAGDRTLRGEDLACLFLRPRPGSDAACVGVVSGTGPSGMRLTDRLPYFISGVGYPDFVAIGPEALERGVAGIRAAGFFGGDWGIASGEFAWRP